MPTHVLGTSPRVLYEAAFSRKLLYYEMNQSLVLKKKKKRKDLKNLQT